MTKTNLLLSLCAAGILVAIFTLPLLVCNIISYGVHLLLP